jgi:hypothetical protein
MNILTESPKNYGPPKLVNKTGIILLICGLVLSVFSFFTDPAKSIFVSLLTFLLFFSIGTGCLFLVALEYLTGAVWSTPLRRITEILASVIIICPLFALPVFFNMPLVFEWARAGIAGSDKIIAAKSAYLNIPFFISRTFIFYIILLLFYRLMLKNSLQQDETADPVFTGKNIRLSALYMVFFTLVITFTAVDWIMSLEPHWVSSIFGVYYFSGTILAALSVVTITAVLLNENNFFKYKLVKDHYYSLGALLFAFTIFWAYIAYCQFMLIWYGNIPAETFWYLHRWDNNWKYFSLGIIFLHFFIPFLALLSRKAKTNPKVLLFMAVWILLSHIYDLYWLVMPVYDNQNVSPGLPEISFFILFCGILISSFVFFARNKSLMPEGDPKFTKGIDFRL